MITVKVDTTGLERKLAALKDQAAFAGALALTRTAQAVQKDLRSEMQSVYQAPTSFTLNSIFIEAATKVSQQATVGVKAGAMGWQGVEVRGGERGRTIERTLSAVGLPRSGQWAIPTAHATFTSGKHVSLSWLRKVVSALQQQNIGSLHQRRRRAAKAQYFALSEKTGRLAAGIYQKDGNNKIVPVILFVSASPRYKAKFKFYEIATASARRNFAAAFEAAVRQTIRTSK